MERKITTLGQVLDIADGLPDSHALYVSGPFPYGATTPCLVVDEDEGRLLELEAAYGDEDGFGYALSVVDTRKVLAEAKRQLPRLSQQQAIEAFNAFYSTDEYIEFAV